MISKIMNMIMMTTMMMMMIRTTTTTMMMVIIIIMTMPMMKMMITLIIIITIAAIIFVNEVTILEQLQKFSVQLVALMFFVFFLRGFLCRGPFLERPGNLSGSKRNS